MGRRPTCSRRRREPAAIDDLRQESGTLSRSATSLDQAPVPAIGMTTSFGSRRSRRKRQETLGYVGFSQQGIGSCPYRTYPGQRCFGSGWVTTRGRPHRRYQATRLNLAPGRSCCASPRDGGRLSASGRAGASARGAASARWAMFGGGRSVALVATGWRLCADGVALFRELPNACSVLWDGVMFMVHPPYRQEHRTPVVNIRLRPTAANPSLSKNRQNWPCRICQLGKFCRLILFGRFEEKIVKSVC